MRYVTKEALGLEIGPSHAPMAPKREGFNVRVLDHTDQAELVAKYRHLGRPQHELDAVESVDYVWSGQSYQELVGPETRFEYIVGSHVVEHTPDLIGFLNDCESVLAHNGRVIMVTPDKRFCFDRFRPLSSLGDVLQQHEHPQQLHPLAPTVDAHAYAARRHGVEQTWTRETTDDPRLVMSDWSEVGDIIHMVRTSREYWDMHRWVFTPTSFSLLVTDLRQLGLIGLEIDAVVEAERFEFVAVLRKTSGGAPALDAAARVEALRMIERELVEQAGIPADHDVHASLVAARSEVAALRGSWSWRATAPLRRWRYTPALKDLVRRGSARLRR
jgi:predicted SAM-dependent methyltransferase